MEKKYLVIKGEAKNHKNEVDKLENTCHIVGSYQDALREAVFLLECGALTAQIYALDAELVIENAVKYTSDGNICNIKLDDYKN